MKYCQNGILAYFDTETQPTNVNPYGHLGHYELQPNDVNGRPYFILGDNGLWWDGSRSWWFGPTYSPGHAFGSAYVKQDVFCPHQLSGPIWQVYKNGDWSNAGNNLLITCKFSFTKKTQGLTLILTKLIFMTY